MFYIDLIRQAVLGPIEAWKKKAQEPDRKAKVDEVKAKRIAAQQKKRLKKDPDDYETALRKTVYMSLLEGVRLEVIMELKEKAILSQAEERKLKEIKPRVNTAKIK